MRTKHLKAISDGKGAQAKEILRKIHAEDGLVKESTTQEETEEMMGSRNYPAQSRPNPWSPYT